MARKNSPASEEALVTPTETAAPAKKSPRSRKAAEPAPVAQPTVEAVSEAPAKKPARKRTAKAEPVVEAAPVETSAAPAPKSRRKPKAEPVLSPEAQAPVVEAEAPAKPSRGRATKKTAPAKDVPAPIELDADETLEVSFRPRAAAASAAKKPDAKPSKKASDFEEIVDPDGVLVLSWRPRSATPAKANQEIESEEEGTSERSGRRRRRRRGKGGQEVSMDANGAQTFVDESDEETPAPAVTESYSEVIDDELTVEVAFRSRAAAPKPQLEKPRERRERGRPERPAAKAEPTPSTQVEEKPVVAEEPPKPTKRPPVLVPPHAPQVVMRNGIPTLVRNGTVYPPIFFAGGAERERQIDNLLNEARMATEAGIHLFSVNLDFEVAADAVSRATEFATNILGRLAAQDPGAQVMFHISFVPPANWATKYPKAKFFQKGNGGNAPSVCDDEFWSMASECLKSFVKNLRKDKNAANVLGVHLDREHWAFPDGPGYDTSPAATEKFRAWARVRYGSDAVALRANWFDGRVSFETITIPEYQPHAPEGEQFVRSSRKQRRYVDYHLFLSDETVNRIVDLAYAAKEASNGEFLVGATYGFTFEWSHPASGHLSLGKLLRAPEIDFIAGPPSYRNREPGGSGSFPVPIDSFALNGKLYLSEEDYKTSLSGGMEPDEHNVALKTPQALDSVHWRGAGTALAHATGIEWSDVFGNGWLNTASVWDRAERVRNTLVKRMAAGTQDPDVIVFIDERALAYLVDQNAFRLLVQNVRESTMRAGLNAGFFLLSDLAHREHFPEAKLYIFLNAWDIRPELRSAIKNRLQKDDKVLFWLYSAGLFDGGRDSLERVREVMGIALKPQPFHSRSGSTILNRRHPLCEAFPERQLSAITQLEPSYFAIPEDAQILGEYSQTGLPSFVVKQFQGDTDAGGRWTSVFLGEPHVNPALIRALAQMADSHVWSFQDDVLHVRPPFLTVHCTGAGMRTIALPGNSSVYNLLTDAWVPIEGFNLRFHGNDGSTHLFLVGEHAEIEAILQRDPADLLRMDALPPKDMNILTDMATFDVPIMKLGEWIETSDSDENADEWFLRPVAVEDMDVSGEDDPGKFTASRRGRRRRGRRDRDDAPKGTGTIIAEDDLEMSVMFRSRS